jgi:hypothetical protein
VGLNYVDRSGTKLRLAASLFSRQFTDVEGVESFGSSQFNRGEPRPSIGSKAVFDLRVAREPSVESEFSLTVLNLFNTHIPDWPGYPRRGRLWMVNLARRF